MKVFRFDHPVIGAVQEVASTLKGFSQILWSAFLTNFWGVVLALVLAYFPTQLIYNLIYAVRHERDTPFEEVVGVDSIRYLEGNYVAVSDKNFKWENFKETAVKTVTVDGKWPVYSTVNDTYIYTKSYRIAIHGNAYLDAEGKFTLLTNIAENKSYVCDRISKCHEVKSIINY
jgi:hypothetical protein